MWGAERGRQFVYSTNLYASEALRDADMRSVDSKPICHYRTGYLRGSRKTRLPGRSWTCRSCCRHMLRGPLAVMAARICRTQSGLR